MDLYIAPREQYLARCCSWRYTDGQQYTLVLHHLALREGCFSGKLTGTQMCLWCVMCYNLEAHVKYFGSRVRENLTLQTASEAVFLEKMGPALAETPA